MKIFRSLEMMAEVTCHDNGVFEFVHWWTWLDVVFCIFRGTLKVYRWKSETEMAADKCLLKIMLSRRIVWRAVLLPSITKPPVYDLLHAHAQYIQLAMWYALSDALYRWRLFLLVLVEIVLVLKPCTTSPQRELKFCHFHHGTLFQKQHTVVDGAGYFLISLHCAVNYTFGVCHLNRQFPTRQSHCWLLNCWSLRVWK